METSTATAYDVVLKKVGPVHVAAMRGTVPNLAQFGDTFDHMFGVLEDYVKRNGRSTGPYIAMYHDSGTGPDMIDMHVELAIPFEGVARDDEHVRVYDLPPAENMACAIHKGPFEEIDNAYRAVYAWVEANGYRMIGPMRDVYLSCGEGDSPDYVTEVQFPIARYR